MGAARWVVLFLSVLLPLAAHAQVIVEEEEEEEVSNQVEEDDMGGPLDLSGLGRAPSAPPPKTERFETSPYWGLKETEFFLVPAGEAHDWYPEEYPTIPSAPWPGKRMLEDWDFGRAFSYPGLAPRLDAELFSVIGTQGRDNTTVFSERTRLDLYFLELGVTFLSSVEGERSSRTNMDLDFRIPIRLGRHHRLALLPGVTFPIDSRPKSDRNSAIRFQGIYGFGIGGFGLQARLGFVEGQRSRGLLLINETVDEPAILYGGLLALRFVPAIQLRVEANGEFVTDGGVDRLTLLGGPVFFPFGDPRISVGALGLLEESSKHLEFSRPGWGGMVQVGIGWL